MRAPAIRWAAGPGAALAAAWALAGSGVGAAPASAQTSATHPDAAGARASARWYLGTYSNHILVWDEASEEVVDRIEVKHPIPSRLTLNEREDRIYVLDATARHVEIVDLERRDVRDGFTLSDGDVTVRIDGLAPSPDDREAVLSVKRYTKLDDRYVVEGPFLLVYDLAAKRVTDTIPFPEGRENVGVRYSPDGETLYLFADDVVALEAGTWKEVDRWKISRPLEPGLGRASFGTGPDTYDPPGVATSLYRVSDPVQNRRLMGIARVRLSEKEVDFFTVGESRSMRGFALAPGGDTAYSLLSEIGRYEFWEFDLEERRLARRHAFPGRPRMGVRVSADGEKLYIYVAGNTIDVYDRETLELVRTVTFEEDMIGVVVVR